MPHNEPMVEVPLSLATALQGMIDQYQAERKALTEATNKAREVLAELHGVVRDAERARKEVERTATTDLAARVNEALAEALGGVLERTTANLLQTEREAKDAILARFDVLAATLLGEDGRSKTRGLPPFHELIKRVIAYEGIPEDVLFPRKGTRPKRHAGPAGLTKKAATEIRFDD